MNEYEEKAQDAGVEAAKILTKALNNMSYENVSIKAFVNAITTSHRTLQQSTMRAILALIMEWASKEEEGCFDGRNEATVKFCKKIKELAIEENAYFPFI